MGRPVKPVIDGTLHYPQCSTAKATHEFPVSRRNPNGFSYICRSCQTQRSAAWRAKLTPEQRTAMRLYKQKWVKAHQRHGQLARLAQQCDELAARLATLEAKWS